MSFLLTYAVYGSNFVEVVTKAREISSNLPFDVGVNVYTELLVRENCCQRWNFVTNICISIRIVETNISEYKRSCKSSLKKKI